MSDTRGNKLGNKQGRRRARHTIASSAATSFLLASGARSAFGLYLPSWGIEDNKSLATSEDLCNAQDDGASSSAQDAALAMNSVAFLSELCALKNTEDVTYYTGIITDGATSVDQGASFGINRSLSLPPSWKQGPRKAPLASSIFTPSPSRALPTAKTYTTTCEYTGRLWFMKRTGIKFRETVRVAGISPDGHSACVECDTDYHNGKKWVECSRVTCTFTSSSECRTSNEAPDTIESGVEMKVDSEVLVRIPLPGIAGNAVRGKIGGVFERAAEEFFNKVGGMGDRGLLRSM